MATNNSTAAQPILCALEYNLGSVALATGTFTDGVAMPTKTIEGSAIQTASLLTMMVVTATLTATSPVITATYTDQSGNTGASCALTIPTNALVNSAFIMTPHLATGDTGVQDVTNITKSAGTAGTVAVRGLLPLAIGFQAGTAGHPLKIEPLTIQYPQFLVEASETIAFYCFGATGNPELIATLTGVAVAS